MTDSTERLLFEIHQIEALKFLSTHSNFSAHIQIKSESRFEFVSRDTEESEFLDLVDLGDMDFSIATVT